MIKVARIILLLTLAVQQGRSQHDADVSDTNLVWNEHYSLQWHDFRGKAGTGSIGDAGTVVHIKAKPFIVNKQIHYDVRAIFNREKSWARDTSRTLLNHERLHFDIAELYARKIRKKVSELRRRGVDDIGTFNDAIKELLLESNDVDAQYDAETLHGALSRKQAEWVRKVGQELADLKNYRKKKWVIGG